LSNGEPLSDMAMTKLLRDMGVADQAVVHGFRSAFRDWATEKAKAREVVAEACLAHAVRDKTEKAYRRATYLDGRAHLMAEWAAYLCERMSSNLRITAVAPQEILEHPSKADANYARAN
jgi:hypothetical protein